MRMKDLAVCEGRLFEDGKERIIPEKGMMLVYPRTSRVIYQPYDALESVVDCLKDMELLELHLFDPDREYRALSSESPRFHGRIEHVAEFPDQKGSVYKDIVMLDTGLSAGRKKLTILHKLAFDNSTGMLSMEDYRMKLEESTDEQ